MLLPDEAEIENSLTKLLKANPDTPLDVVLLNPDFYRSVKSEVSILYQYFRHGNVLAEMLAWALTPQYKDEEMYRKKAYSAVVALTMEARKIQDPLHDSHVFYEVVQRCIDTNFFGDPQIAGHFQQILLSSVKYTNGAVLRRFPNLIEKLIENMDMTSMKELLLQLLTKYRGAFTDDEYNGVAENLASATKTDHGYFVVGTILDILQHGDKSNIETFQRDRVIRALLESVTMNGKRRHERMLQAQLFDVIEKISKDSASASVIISEFQEQFRFDPDNVTCATVAALRVFKQALMPLLPHFFDDPGITELNQLIMERIEELPAYTLKEAIETHSLAQRVMDVWDTHLVNGHITEMALFLDSQRDVSPTLQTPQWKMFVESKVRPRDADREIQVPNTGTAPDPILGCGVQATMSFGGYGASGRVGIQEMIHFAEDMRDIQGQKRAGLGGKTLNKACLSGARAFGAKSAMPTLYQADTQALPMLC